MTPEEMGKEWIDLRDANKKRWFLGNNAAISLVTDFMDIVETWDDLIDKDNDTQDDQISMAFTMALLTLPSNPLFIEHRVEYVELFRMVINAWHDSNDMAGSDNERYALKAFDLRNLGLEIYQSTAFFVGGYTHLRKVSREMREFFCFEDYEEWRKENA